MSSEQASDEIDLMKVFAILWRRKYLIAGICLLFVLLGGYYAFKLATPIYRASSVTMMSSQAEQIIDLPSVLGQLGTDDVALQSEIEVIRSRILLGKVVDELDLTSDPEFNHLLREPTTIGKLAAYLRSMLSVGSLQKTDWPAAERTRDDVVTALLENFQARVVPNTTTFRITVESEVPEKAALIADTIARQYVQRQVDVKRGATVDAIDWLSEQVADLKVALEKSENAVKQFKTSTPLTTIEVLSGLERQLKSIRDRISETRRKISETERLRSVVEQADGYSAKAAIIGDTALRDLSETASENPADARRFETRMRALLADRSRDTEQARAQLVTLESAEKSLEEKVQRESQAFIELEQLTREAEANRTLYEYFLGRLKETSAQQGIQQADSIILSYAVVPSEASEPHRKRIVVVSGFLGFLLGCGLSLLLEMRNNTFRTSQELEELVDMPVIGLLPLVPSQHRGDVAQYIAEHPTSPFAEAVRNLRTSILLANVDHPPQVIVASSSLPGEGKTTSSIGLALNFVSMGKKVLLIEGDLRRLTLYRYFGTPRSEAGLVSVLSGKMPLESAITHHAELGLDVLYGGRTAKNAADVLSSMKMDELLKGLRGEYDFIIIDAPPVLVVPDARVLSQFVDSVLFIVKWDSTHHHEVMEAVKAFDREKIGGLVLNQIDPDGFKRYGYSYGYGYGYAAHYGDKYYDPD